jgi:periplasmic divalent cation tolerance protein
VASPFRVVLITAPRGQKAETLARGLVTDRLAACVNILPGVISHYRWEGKVQRGAECLLVVKTTASKLPALKRWIAANHPYTTPELLALKVDGGAKTYLNWLAGELNGPRGIPRTSNVGNAGDNS